MQPSTTAPSALEPSGAPHDPVLRDLLAKPFAVMRPFRWTAPFVFASPHSGRTYPPSFLALSALDPVSLRRSEDAFVDKLFGAVPDQGAAFLVAHFPRAYLDVNRAEREFDPAMFDGPVSAHEPATRNARVAAGLGVIPRVVREGMEIYRAPLPAAEAALRLDSFYRPYHAALAGLIAETKAAFGTAVVIDCHSMPPPLLTRGYDVVIGDRHGESASAALSAEIGRRLAGLGYSVGRNSPYAGGHTTRLYGQPGAGVHAVQIEINRKLYLDEKRMEKSAGFEDCRTTLTRFVAGLLATPGPWRLDVSA